MKLNAHAVLPALRSFLTEDLGSGDLTAPLLAGQMGHGIYLAKQDGVVAGQQIPNLLYRLLDSGNSLYLPSVADGTPVTAGTVLGKVRGPLTTSLAAERLSLNLMQRMSGIATATRAAVESLNDPHTKILDTRKTAPGLRIFDKYAVRCGGGENHRMGLYDLAMIKDNHWLAVGDLTRAVTTLRAALGPSKRIEVEVENTAELTAAIAALPDLIMFDNQSPETVRQWQARVPAGILTEVSGGITPTTLPSYAGTGADYLSLGYLTNQVANLDISFYLK